MERPSIDPTAVGESSSSSNSSSHTATEGWSPTTAAGPTPKSRVMSKVLKRLTAKKWRRRRSRTASEALSDSGVRSTFSFSESGSISSSMLEGCLTAEEEEGPVHHRRHRQQQQQSNVELVSRQAATEETGDYVATLLAFEASTSSITVGSSQSTCAASTAAGSTLALCGDLDDWFKTAHALLTSNEMRAFLKSSNRMVTSAVVTSAGTALTAGGMVVKTAFLPVTLPLNVAASTTDLVINVAGGVIRHVINGDDDEHDPGRIAERKVYHTPAQDFLHDVFNFIPFVVQNTVKIVKPALGMQPSRSTQAKTIPTTATTVPPRNRRGEQLHSSADDIDTEGEPPEVFLRRLRLDIYPSFNEEFKLGVIQDVVGDDDDDDATTRTDTTETSASLPTNPSGATKADFSKFLLRVDDVNVLAPPNPASDKVLRALYVDLDGEFGDERITMEALAQLIQRGMDVASSNPAVNFSCTPVHQAGKSNATEIEWKPEGKTKRDVKTLSTLPQGDFYDALRSKVLIWSGSYRGPKYHGSDNALFMARGVVNGSPRQFTSMLWDSSRTREYNKFCLGRKDVSIINDEISNGGSYGVKIIKSETQVPFTSLSVFLSAVMHARALGDRPEDGFMIFSRSLDTGRAGCHVGKRDGVDQGNKNEIILGVNIMRSVPGHPELTDLTSVSQVRASMVPPFLAFRIGMMGVEDFFKNVRS